MKIQLDKRKICIAVTVVAIVGLLACEIVGFEGLLGDDPDPMLTSAVEMTVTRAIGGVVFITILIYLGYRVLNPIKKPFWKGVLFALPALCVAVNNFPIYPVVSGAAAINAQPFRIALFIAQCVMVSFFEECCFRGVIFLGFLKNRRGTVLKRFIAIALSAAVFGLVHLVNVALGASLGAVILQVGYSFLIGAMCSVVLMKTSNLWLCVILHAVYNFGGGIIEQCGEGARWDAFTVVITVIVAVATTAYMVISFFKIKESELERLYE